MKLHYKRSDSTYWIKD